MRLALIAVLLAACAPAPPGGLSDPGRFPSISPSAPTVATSSPAGASAWRRIADIPTPRSEVAAVVFRGTIFVVGGFGGGDVVEALAGDRWSAAPHYPLAVDHAMAAGVDAEGTPGVYVFGGNVNGVATARSFRLFGDQGWREIAPMPGPRAQGAAAAVGGKIYVIGGAAAGRLVAPTYVYDTAADRWITAAPIPTARDHLAAATFGGRVCAVGGRRLSMLQNLASLECYDPAGDAWTALPDMPTARGGLGAAAIGDRLYVVGGEQPLGTFRELEVFDRTTNRWSRGPDLPTPRHGLGVVAVGSTLFVLSGGPTPGASQTPVCEALSAP
jgi:non-specific serine/threonine protein kinase